MQRIEGCMKQTGAILLLLSSALSGTCQQPEESENDVLATLGRADRLLQQRATEETERTLQQACSHAERLNPRGPLVSVAANRLANLYREAGRDADAEFYYLKALPAAQGGGATR